MKTLLKESPLFIILFLLIILKEPIINMIKVRDTEYKCMECEFLKQDYNKLLEFNEIDSIYELDYINTIILYKDIYNYLNEIKVRGGKDQDFDNNPVIYDNTLIGLIDKVEKNSSTVKLLTNPKSKVSVMINDEIGVLEVINNELVVNNISNYSNISIGDAIFTSGLGNIRENIFIGTVKGIEINQTGIEKRIIIDYQIDIKKINYVSVLREKK